jgi:hypothetical protein
MVLGKKFHESHLIPEPEVRCSVLVTKCNSADQIKNKKDGRACGAYGEEEKYIQGFGEKTRSGWNIIKMDLEREIG